MSVVAIGLPASAGRPDVFIGLVLVLVLVAAVAAAVRELWTRAWHGRARVRPGFRTRVRWRMWPGPGWAGRWSLWRQHGRPAARKVAQNARPSLSWAQRRFGPWREYAAFLGWGPGWVFRSRVYAHLESLILIIAAPQEGKSQAAAGAILDAPGPVVATSIRGDLIRATAALRAGRGLVHVWNPEGIGEFGSTFRMNITAGCESVETAVRRAGMMVEGITARGLGDDDFWNDQASMTLAALMHAAALVGRDITTVYQWISSNDPAPLQVLWRHPGADPAARMVAQMYARLPERTRSGIMATLSRVLRFMTLPACVEAVTTPDGGPGFDFERFVWSRDTLYLVASDGAGTPVTPLFLLLVGELAHVARLAGAVARPARRPRGPVLGLAWPARLLDRLFPVTAATRLDPPLTMVLDEVANTAPVPVEKWSSWAAGSGVRLVLVAQAWAQLVQRWGVHGAATVWQCCKTKVIYGATSEPELGRMVEQLCDTVRLRVTERVPGKDGQAGRRVHRHEEVRLLPAGELRQLPLGYAVVVQGHGLPAVVRVEQVRRRADVKAAQRSGLRVALPAPAVRRVPLADPRLLGDDRPGRPVAWPGSPDAVPDQLAERRAGRTAARHDGQGGGMPAPKPPATPAPWERPASGDGER
jgi:type IV secretion system protein VirD4